MTRLDDSTRLLDSSEADLMIDRRYRSANEATKGRKDRLHPAYMYVATTELSHIMLTC